MTYSAEVLADSPLAYWRLDETSGTTAADATGNGRTGVYSGGYTLGQASLVASDTSGKSVLFGGTNGVVTVAYASWMDSANFTAECVFKPTDVSGGTRVLVSRQSSGPLQWTVRREGSALKAYGWYSGTGGFVTITAPTALVAGTTYHVALTRSGTTLTLYVNGASVGTATLGTVSTEAAPLRIGASDASTEYSNDTIDEVAFYGAALSGSRLAAHYAAATGGALAAFSGTVAATATVSGSLLANRALSGTVATTSTVAGAFAVPAALAGTIAATSGVSGAITVSTPGDLSGTIELVSGLTVDPDEDFDGGTYESPALPDLSTLIPRRVFASSLPPR